MKKVKLIYNPNSGDKKISSELDKIIQTYQRYNYSVVPFRLCKDKAIEEAFFDIECDYDHILICGGDGTVDLVVNVVKAMNIDIPIAILPCGTANDFAKAVNLPFDIKECIEKIINSKPRSIDIGKINNKYFINVASAGMFTDVSQKIKPEIKNSIGKVSYYLKGIEEALYMRKFNIEVNSQEVSYIGEMYLMLIFNGKTAGNINLAYKSELDDGLLDIIIVKNIFTPNIVQLLISILRGEHLEGYNKDEILYFKASKLTIDCKDNLTTDIDGERGPNFPLQIECIQDSIKILGY